MPSKSKQSAIDEIIDCLYGLPLAEFTSARNEAASELRKAGQRDAAERVKALSKPTVPAAAVNRLVPEHRGEVEQFLRAAVVLRDAQFAGKGDLTAATRQEREELDKLVRAGGEAVRQTLLAAAADEDAAKQLLDARLVRELELAGFGTLLAHVRPGTTRPPGPTPAQAGQAPPKTKKPGDGAALARLHDAQASLGTAEADERRARSRWEQTQREIETARAALEAAQRTLERARASVDTARRDLDKTQAAVEGARRDLDRTQAAVDEARRDLEKARTNSGR